MKIPIPYDISNYSYADPDFVRNLANVMNAIGYIVNGKLTFSDNFDCILISCTFNKANTQQAFLHGLNRIPKGYIITGKQAAAQVYDGTNASTIQFIYLASTVATTVRMLIF